MEFSIRRDNAAILIHPFSCQEIKGRAVRVCNRPTCFLNHNHPRGVVPDVLAVIWKNRIRETDIKGRFATRNDAVLRLAVHLNRRCCNPERVRDLGVCVAVTMGGLETLCQAMYRL